MQDIFKDLVEQTNVTYDPMAGSGVSHQCHPAYFNVLDNSKFYSDAVPLEVERYTIFPDSLLNAFTHFDLDGVEIKLLMYLHKKTLGYVSNSNEHTLSQYKELPYNTVKVTYSDFNTSKHKATRSRFYKITMRRLAEEFNVSKSTMHRKILKLENLKIIQKHSNRYNGTAIGINYHTLNSIFSVSVYGTKEPATRIKNMSSYGLVKSNPQKQITKVKTCIENLSHTLPRNLIRSPNDLQDHEKVMILSVFKGNKFVLN